MDTKRKYKFSWDLIFPETDADYRPSLGMKTDLEVYRLLQYTIRDVLEERYGTETADEIFRNAGRMAGQCLYEKYFSKAENITDLANTVQEQFRALGMGIVRFEKVDLENMVIQLTVDEDLDCSGLPDTGDQICVYDEGLIQGILESFTKRPFHVRETDCWCTGERTCRFQAKVMDGILPD